MDKYFKEKNQGTYDVLTFLLNRRLDDDKSNSVTRTELEEEVRLNKVKLDQILNELSPICIDGRHSPHPGNIKITTAGQRKLEEMIKEKKNKYINISKLIGGFIVGVIGIIGIIYGIL